MTQRATRQTEHTEPRPRDATRLARHPVGPFWRGLGEAVAVAAGVVGFGLVWAALVPPAGQQVPAAPYSPAMGGPTRGDAGSDEGWDEPGTQWLVDGFNLLHAGILGGRDRSEWWTAPRRAEVLERVAEARVAGAERVVVFDGARDPGEPPPAGGVREVFAASADDWLLRRVKHSPDPSQVAVVTADRRLAARVAHCGARVVHPSDFLRRCPSRGEAPPPDAEGPG